MKTEELIGLYTPLTQLKTMLEQVNQPEITHTNVRGLRGGSRALVALACALQTTRPHLFILPDKESASFFYGDMEQLLQEETTDIAQRQAVFFPEESMFGTENKKSENFAIFFRTKTLQRIEQGSRLLVISYPEALMQKVIQKEIIAGDAFVLSKGERLTVEFMMDFLTENKFEYIDFVFQPGQFSIRGGIVDVFSYTNEYPYRIEFSDDSVVSLRTFEIETQLSKAMLDKIVITPNLIEKEQSVLRINFFDTLPPDTLLWFEDMTWCLSSVEKNETILRKTMPETLDFSTFCIHEKQFHDSLLSFSTVAFGSGDLSTDSATIHFDTQPQLLFNKQFDLLIDQWIDNYEHGIVNIFSSPNENQSLRMRNIVRDILSTQDKYRHFPPDYREILKKEILTCVSYTLHEGFSDKQQHLAFYTDHQIFNRYHRYKVDDKYTKQSSQQLKEIYDLRPGDYVTHIDHGIGQYLGLEKINISGREQESLKIRYKDNDMLFISIHSIHRIAKYSGQEDEAPTLNRLGGHAWNKVKEQTKGKVKTLLIDLAKLYAQRKTSAGFAFSPDSYLQAELEASFIYEDTPDQVKATQDVKQDMEASYPMDRLICGDVGFGKTEIAIRAAFKALYDNKQVAILVPTTILALQHYNTFRDRMANFPCTVDYINRFKPLAKRKKTLQDVAEGKVDIIIGTHRLLGKDIVFKDLGLLIVDEEQKFGVSAKEKLRSLKVNVDTMTMTATPIPRTLQFSLMGARDISIMLTPPLNRYPIQTEVCSFSDELIRSAIEYELLRAGQVFVVHNRIQNIDEIAGMIQHQFPNQQVAVAHGQMEGDKLERIMMDFIDGYYDILVSTTIIESGLDIPNANTIIINDAQNYGLSDLHQLRGRVGRKNKKAFCYLLTPPKSILSDTARKRLRALVDFSDIGSGFNIAMRDLDIRGAGNLLGAEQSGFITEIGYEMYQKILNEALDEYRQSEMAAETSPDGVGYQYIKDCVIETDMELLLPDSYVSNSEERYSLYKELNNLVQDDALDTFRQKLADRFGVIPQQTEELIKTIGLRRIAQKIGFEKIILKQGKLIGSFLSNEHSPYFQSQQFSFILTILQKNPTLAYMRENNQKLTLTFDNISSIEKAIQTLQILVDE